MKLYNSLTNSIEPLSKQPGDTIGMYTCGPTVYSYVSIGNWRTYTLGDLLYRSLKHLGYQVDYVMNITDVGHLTGDNEGDADTGEDRLEKAAARENKTAWDVADFYTQDFLRGFEHLNLVKPKHLVKATDHIPEQIAMVEAIEKAGFTYRIDDGIYFDVAAYEKAGHSYGQLSTLDQIKAGARVTQNNQKRDDRDFALWKFNTTGRKRDMEWDSPWGTGFPGWHIECSAMSCKYLGDQFDIHIGGEDLRSTHHPNEIAQAEAATGKSPFVQHWVHGAFLLVDGGRMGKSLGNAYTIQDVVKHHFDPLTLRYFYLTGHYRKQLNFTWDGMMAAQTSLFHLREYVARFTQASEGEQVDEGQVSKLKAQFDSYITDDLNIPGSLGFIWEIIKAEALPSIAKLSLLRYADEIYGLKLFANSGDIPKEVRAWAIERERMRSEKQYDAADNLRAKIEQAGYKVEDSKDAANPVIIKIHD